MYVLTSGVKLQNHLLNVVIRFIVFLNSANLICRGTDISKYSRESLGLRDNKSQLYIKRQLEKTTITEYSPPPKVPNKVRMTRNDTIQHGSVMPISLD